MRKLFCRQTFWKTPYNHDFEPTWKASNGCCMVWVTAENAWFLITPYKKTMASCEAKLLNWGFDKMNLPDGLVKTPALNNSFGSKGEAKFRVLSCYAMELWQKKQKAPSFRAAARAAKCKSIPRPKQVLSQRTLLSYAPCFCFRYPKPTCLPTTRLYTYHATSWYFTISTRC